MGFRSAGCLTDGGVWMRLAVIPGDGIGPEVVTEALKVLTEVVPNAEITNVRPRRISLACHRRIAARVGAR